MLRSEMAIARNGSTILFVVLMTSVIMSCAYIFWQRSTWYALCMDERMRYEQQIALLDGAIRYGITYVQHHYKTLLDEPGRVLNLDAYAQLMQAEYHLVMRLSPVPAGNIAVCAQLYHHTNPLHAVRCVVTPLPDTKVAISGWHID